MRLDGGERTKNKGAGEWWGAGKNLGRWRNIDEEKIGREKGGKAPAFSRSRPSLPSFFRLVFLFALAAYDLTCSPLSKRLEQAKYWLAPLAKYRTPIQHLAPARS